MIKSIIMLAAAGGAMAQPLSSEHSTFTSLRGAIDTGVGVSPLEVAHGRLLMRDGYGGTDSTVGTFKYPPIVDQDCHYSSPTTFNHPLPKPVSRASTASEQM